jgi:hypothetical protein
MHDTPDIELIRTRLRRDGAPTEQTFGNDNGSQRRERCPCRRAASGISTVNAAEPGKL